MYLVLLLALLSGWAVSQKNPQFEGKRTTIVHLFEWKFKDIADECERFLAPNGYGGVQVSPVNENAISTQRAWWERYQPISYLIATRSGDEKEFLNMTTRCNRVGVRIYVDVVFNHMAADAQNIIGTGGSTANVSERNYPAVPYENGDFHPRCTISNYSDPQQVRNCQLGGLPDLNQSRPYVRTRILEFLNNLIRLGAAGFRVDAAKHMWPQDLQLIYTQLNNLNSAAFAFPRNTRPFIYQEVIDVGAGEGVTAQEYNTLAVVTEFKYSTEIGKAFRGGNALKYLRNWGVDWGFLPSNDAVVFVDNHDNQRGHGAGGVDILTYKNQREYRMAVAFMLVHPYGIPRVMSSFAFANSDQGPPADKNGAIQSPTFDNAGQCNNGWVCEHRWSAIVNVVKFRNDVGSLPLLNWWDNGGNQIAFSRGHSGFIAFNNDVEELHVTLETGLSPGVYCDITFGGKIGNKCSGKSIHVGSNGTADIILSKENGVLAIVLSSKI